MQYSHRSLVAGLLAIGLMLAGCDRQDPIRTYDAPKEPRNPAPSTENRAAPSASGISGPVQWTLPEGWQQSPGSGMRYATLVTDGQPPLDLSVTILAQQSVLDNINRWEGQVGLPSTPEAELEKVIHRVSTSAGEIVTVDLLGPPQPNGAGVRVLGAILPLGPQMWFFKMTGPPEQIGAQKEKFLALIGSIRVNPQATR